MRAWKGGEKKNPMMNKRQSQVAQLLWQQLHANQPFFFFLVERYAVISDGHHVRAHSQLTHTHQQQAEKKNPSNNATIAITMPQNC